MGCIYRAYSDDPDGYGDDDDDDNNDPDDDEDNYNDGFFREHP